MAAKMLAATQNINTNKQNQLKITKETLFSNFAAVVCVYWYTGLPLVCDMKIFAFKMLFFQFLFVWQENDLVFSSELEKNSIKNNNIKIAPCPPPPAPPPTHTHTHTHTLKFSMLRVQ